MNEMVPSSVEPGSFILIQEGKKADKLKSVGLVLYKLVITI